MARKEAVSLRFKDVFHSPDKMDGVRREMVADVKYRGVSSMLRQIPVKVDVIKMKF